jgi:opacity protein-like surface antigen
MLKKLLCLSAFCALFSNLAFAEFYIGPTLTLTDMSAKLSSFRGLTPRLALGYNSDVGNDTFLAAEFFVAPGAIVISNNSSYGADLRPTRTFGASLLPGFVLGTSKVLGYLRLGFVDTHFIGPGLTRLGYQAGVGLQTSLPDGKWAIRGEYDYSSYRSMAGVGVVKADDFSIGFIRKFDF